ncbi:MAG: DUF3788 family protein [Eubacteriales bacterium]
MHQRLSNKQQTPTIAAFISHIGKASEFFHAIDTYLKDNFPTEFKLYFDAHDKGWAISYHSRYLSKKTYLCNIVAEKDAFLFVTNIKIETLDKLYKTVTKHAKECIDESPYRHRGWIEYRIKNAENLEEAVTKILQSKIDGTPAKFITK